MKVPVKGARGERKNAPSKRVAKKAAASSVAPPKKRAAKKATSKPAPLVTLDDFDRALGLDRQADLLASEDLTPSEIALDRATMDRLVETGLFDPDWYRRRYRDVAQAGADPARHFLEAGAAENRWPNAHFDPDWYVRHQLDGAPLSVHPVVHYLEKGERAGLRPITYFDPDWYRERYLGSFDDLSPLGHYLLSRAFGHNDPNLAFDTAFYVRENPDVVAAGIDPFEHFLEVGYREGRNPSAEFDVRYYQRRHLHGQDINPLVHFIEVGARLGNNPDPNAEPTPAAEVRRFSRPAREFEEFQPEIAAHREKLAKLIAFYLPQFHPFPENDDWWGTGFTEWTNLSRGNPRFEGHYQPRVPRDLGFYDLRDLSVMRRQVELALAAGLHGFCFYYYNFNGKRLLHGPVEAFLDTPDIDFPFCIIWANENWSRRWDGSESEILIRQDYRPEDAAGLIDDLARHFKDPRYIRVGGRPLFFIYRAGIIPHPRETISHWRDLFRERHGEDPLFFLAQTFTDHDPGRFGLDGALEFPPHKILSEVHPSNPKIEFFDHGFAGYVYQYDEVVEASLGVPKPDFPLIKTAFPSWDNDARRQGRGVTVTGSTPRKYQRWLEQLVASARQNPVAGEPFVFINAWNEWAEGAYLEPDIHYGSAYLNATARAVIGQQAERTRYPVLLVTGGWANPDTRAATFDLARTLSRGFGCEVHLLRLDGGPAARDRGDFASIVSGSRPEEVERAIADHARRGGRGAILFGAAAGSVVAALHARKLRAVAVLGELPVTISAHNNRELARLVFRDADIVVAPSASVMASLETEFGPVGGKAVVRPPADRAPPARIAGAKARALAMLGLRPGTRLVINSGPATIQSGADLFAAAARVVTSRRDDVAFVWFGDIKPDLKLWLEAGFPGGVLQFRPDAGLDARPIAVADMVAFTAREDASAIVVSDAIAAGVPVAAFDASGTGADLAGEADPQALVPFGDVAALADRIMSQLDRGRVLGARAAAMPRKGRATTAERAFELLQDTDPALRRISVVMAPDAGSTALEARMVSLFEQTVPVMEIVVLGDRLPVRAREEVQRIADNAHREVRFSERAAGSNLAGILAAAAEETTGEFLWVVPGEGRADPALLANLTEAMVSTETIAAWAQPLPSLKGQRPPPAGKRTGAELAADLAQIESADDDLGAVVWRRAVVAKTFARGRSSGDGATLSDAVRRVAERGPVYVGREGLSSGADAKEATVSLLEAAQAAAKDEYRLPRATGRS